MRSVRVLRIAAATLLIASASISASADPGQVRLRTHTLSAGDPLLARESVDGLWIVHFDTFVGRVQHDALTGAGAEVLDYLPEHAFLLLADPVTATRLPLLPGVDLVSALRPEWKLAPELNALVAGSADRPLELSLSFAPGTSLSLRADQALALGAQLRGRAPSAPRPRLGLRASADLLPALSRLPDLIWIGPAPVAADRMERVKWIAQSGLPELTPVWDRGLHGEGEVIGHIDSQFDADNCWFGDPEGDPFGPEHRKVVYRGESVVHSQTHGTHTAGILAGDAAPMNEDVGTAFRGIAWAARLAHSDYVGLDTYDLYATLMTHEGVGARVHSNSWGYSSAADTTYLPWCVDIDAFSHDYEDNLVVFAVMNGPYLLAPENAKNVLAVGASYVLDDLDGGYDFHVRYSGGIGPTADGRRKPEIFAPGYNLDAARAGQDCLTWQLHGTSMACPVVTGAAALARQYFVEGWYPGGAANLDDALTPSGALLRAMLLNATLPMDSLSPTAPDPELARGYPNDAEGWGRLTLDEALYFAGDSRELWVTDVRNAQGLENGEEIYYRFDVESGAESLAITLAFTDPPGSLLAEDPVVNDMDLNVEGPDGRFLGNHFDTLAEESVTGGEADSRNTVERVLVNAPTPGTWLIVVRASAVPLGPQGYALVINGDLGAEVETITPEPAFLAVAQNYPNPFVAGEAARGGTTLSFELRASQKGTLRIYDVTGRRVRTLFEDEDLSFGVNERVWDGRDDSGEMSMSGIYFARVHTESGGKSPSVRIVLLR